MIVARRLAVAEPKFMVDLCQKPLVDQVFPAGHRSEEQEMRCPVTAWAATFFPPGGMASVNAMIEPTCSTPTSRVLRRVRVEPAPFNGLVGQGGRQLGVGVLIALRLTVGIGLGFGANFPIRVCDDRAVGRT